MLKGTWECKYLFGLLFLFSSDKYPPVELLDCMVVLFLIFWGTSILVSISLYQFTPPPKVHIGSLFSRSSLKLFCLFDNSHANRCEVIHYYSFWFTFPWCLVMWSIFYVPVCHLYVLFGKMYLQIFWSFFNSTLYVWVMICKYLLPFILSMTSFLLLVQRLFSLMRSRLLWLLLFLLVVSNPKNHHQVQWQGAYCLRFPSRSFIISVLTFESLIHYELIFEHGAR